MTARFISMVSDSTGQYSFDPKSCAHTYTYNGDGTMATDLAYDPVNRQTFLKTYTYTAGKLTSESAWVKH
jgi:hypothetical protein